jgi:hypothetical protein
VSEAAITAMDRGRLAIVWIAGGDVFGSVVNRSGAPTAPAPLSQGAGASGLSVDMGVDEVAYAVWAQAGAGGSDVRAARLVGNNWTTIGPPLDFDPSQSAGTGDSRPRVAVSADGNAVATWGETAPDGRNHVYGRRIIGLNPSSYPQDLTVNDFEGQRAGNADSPDIDIEDDPSWAWVVFRQDVGGRSRTLARRLVGSSFDPPAAIDGGATTTAPRIDFTGKGIGAAVSAAADNAVFSSYLDKFNVFNRGVRIDGTPSGTAPFPVVATSERGDAYVAWRTGAPDGSGAVHVRRKNGQKGFEPEVALSNPAFGAVVPGEVEIGADRLGNAAVAMLQGGPGGRRIAVGVYDRLPGRPALRRSKLYRSPKPLLKWFAGIEHWGRQRFTVLVDGKVVGRTNKTRLQLRRRLREGRHRWQVLAADRRGQVAKSRVRSFRVSARLAGRRAG